jgi:hypothetical protein
VLLQKAAQLKALDMTTRGYYAHVSPDGKTPLYWLDSVGYRYLNIGENLDANASSASSAQNAWMGSIEHRKNLLRAEYTEVGVGVAEGPYKNNKNAIFVVVFFATPYPAPVVIVKPKPIAIKLVTPLNNTPAISVPFPVSKNSTATSTTSTTPVQKALAKIIAPITKPLQATTTVATVLSMATSSPQLGTSTQSAIVPPFEVSAPVLLHSDQTQIVNVRETLGRYAPDRVSVPKRSSTWITAISKYLDAIFISTNFLRSPF